MAPETPPPAQQGSFAPLYAVSATGKGPMRTVGSPTPDGVCVSCLNAMTLAPAAVTTPSTREAGQSMSTGTKALLQTRSGAHCRLVQCIRLRLTGTLAQNVARAGCSAFCMTSAQGEQIPPSPSLSVQEVNLPQGEAREGAHDICTGVVKIQGYGRRCGGDRDCGSIDMGGECFLHLLHLHNGDYSAVKRLPRSTKHTPSTSLFSNQFAYPPSRLSARMCIPWFEGTHSRTPSRQPGQARRQGGRGCLARPPNGSDACSGLHCTGYTLKALLIF